MFIQHTFCCCLKVCTFQQSFNKLLIFVLLIFLGCLKENYSSKKQLETLIDKTFEKTYNFSYIILTSKGPRRQMSLILKLKNNFFRFRKKTTKNMSLPCGFGVDFTNMFMCNIKRKIPKTSKFSQIFSIFLRFWDLRA